MVGRSVRPPLFILEAQVYVYSEGSISQTPGKGLPHGLSGVKRLELCVGSPSRCDFERLE